MIRLSAEARAAAIEYDGPVTPREKRHDADLPGIAGPPGRGREQHRLALSLFFIIDVYVADLSGGHVKPHVLDCSTSGMLRLAMGPVASLSLVARHGLFAQTQNRKAYPPAVLLSCRQS